MTTQNIRAVNVTWELDIKGTDTWIPDCVIALTSVTFNPPLPPGVQAFLVKKGGDVVVPIEDAFSGRWKSARSMIHDFVEQIVPEKKDSCVITAADEVSLRLSSVPEVPTKATLHGFNFKRTRDGIEVWVFNGEPCHSC